MKEIFLTQNKITTVDDSDFAVLSKYRWRAHKSLSRSNGKILNWYAIRNDGKRPNRKVVYMHRQVLSVGKGKIVDHINSNGLDNRTSNLRIATPQQNVRNGRSYGFSEYRGVSWQENARKWRAMIKIDGKHLWLGLFQEEREAAKVYNRAAQEYFGAFARLN